jgi:hypothetical protein
MVVIKYALVCCLIALGIIGSSRRDAVLAAYRWDPTLDKPLIPSFDPQAVAEATRLAVPASELRVAVAPDTRTVRVPDLAGSTTTTVPPVQGGRAVLAGTVIGPGNSPVAGATVRIERFVGEQVVAVDVVSGANGSFAVGQLLGGRYRIRAWRAPVLTQTNSEVTFLADGEQRSLQLTLRAPNMVDIWASVSPGTVTVGQTGALTMRVMADAVNDNGLVVAVGRPGAVVAVAGTGVLNGQGASLTTDANGSALFAFACRQAGAGGFTMTSGAVKQTTSVTCAPPATTTTAKAPVPAAPAATTTTTTRPR